MRTTLLSYLRVYYKERETFTYNQNCNFIYSAENCNFIVFNVYHFRNSEIKSFCWSLRKWQNGEKADKQEGKESIEITDGIRHATWCRNPLN